MHNSGWVQSPGKARLADVSSYPRLKAYMQDVMRTFAKAEVDLIRAATADAEKEFAKRRQR